MALLFWGSKLCPVHRAEAQKGREGNKMRDQHEASVASDAFLPQIDIYTLPLSATDKRLSSRALFSAQDLWSC